MGGQIMRGAGAGNGGTGAQSTKHEHNQSRSESGFKKASALNVMQTQKSLKQGGLIAVNKDNFKELRIISE